jgi:hypothetical protein
MRQDDGCSWFSEVYVLVWRASLRVWSGSAHVCMQTSMHDTDMPVFDLCSRSLEAVLHDTAQRSLGPGQARCDCEGCCVCCGHLDPFGTIMHGHCCYGSPPGPCPGIIELMVLFHDM